MLARHGVRSSWCHRCTAACLADACVVSCNRVGCWRARQRASAELFLGFLSNMMDEALLAADFAADAGGSVWERTRAPMVAH